VKGLLETATFKRDRGKVFGTPGKGWRQYIGRAVLRFRCRYALSSISGALFFVPEGQALFLRKHSFLSLKA
jgi:hypothetical protein